MYILLLWNAFVFFLYGFDKNQSVKDKRRISEKFLLCCTLLYGGVGAFFGMFLFRHKTKKLKFKIIVPFLAITQVALLWILLK